MIHMPAQKLTHEVLAAAINGFEAQKARIDAQIAEVRQILAGNSSEPAATPETPIRKRKFSAAARRRMKEAQQRRWAAIREAEPTSVTPEAPKPKRKLSAAGRRAIVAALKKRWASKKAREGEAQAPVVKKATRKAARKKVAV